jgi:hypothetical protein
MEFTRFKLDVTKLRRGEAYSQHGSLEIRVVVTLSKVVNNRMIHAIRLKLRINKWINRPNELTIRLLCDNGSPVALEFISISCFLVRDSNRKQGILKCLLAAEELILLAHTILNSRLVTLNKAFSSWVRIWEFRKGRNDSGFHVSNFESDSRRLLGIERGDEPTEAK